MKRKAKRSPNNNRIRLKDFNQPFEDTFDAESRSDEQVFDKSLEAPSTSEESFDAESASKEELFAKLKELQKRLADVTLERDELKEIVAEREIKPLNIDKPVDAINFDQKPTLKEAEAEFSKTLPNDVSDYKLKYAKKQFAQLTPNQKVAYFYLNNHQNLNKDRTPEDHIFYGLSDFAMIRILLIIAFQMKGFFGDCIGDKDRESRPYVYFYDVRGMWRQTTSARTILGFLYGFNNLIGKHTSHLCGNYNCLNPLHLWSESPEVNWSRDVCHANGYTKSPECSHWPHCLPSLKFGLAVKFASRIFEFVKFPLSAARYAKNHQGGQNIQINDREYSDRGGAAGRYCCIYREGRFLCDAYVKIQGDWIVEKRGHVDGCPKISELNENFLIKTEKMIEDNYVYNPKDPTKIKNVKIGLHKYYLAKKTWTCTIGTCYGSIEIKNGRYQNVNPHKCDLEAKQKEMEEERERQENLIDVTLSAVKISKGKNKGKFTNRYSTPDGKTYDQKKQCTRSKKSGSGNCSGRLKLYDNMKAVICNPHNCE